MTTAAVPKAPATPRPAHLKLYEATDELNAAYELLAETEGEWTPEIEELFNGAKLAFGDKAERVALKIREFIASAAAVKAEKERLAALEASFARSGDALKSYLKREMERAGVPKVEGRLAKIRIQNNSQPSVQSTLDQETLRQLYGTTEFAALINRKETFALIAKNVTDRAAAGEPLPDGVAVEHGTHLRVS